MQFLFSKTKTGNERSKPGRLHVSSWTLFQKPSTCRPVRTVNCVCERERSVYVCVCVGGGGGEISLLENTDNYSIVPGLMIHSNSDRKEERKAMAVTLSVILLLLLLLLLLILTNLLSPHPALLQSYITSTTIQSHVGYSINRRGHPPFLSLTSLRTDSKRSLLFQANGRLHVTPMIPQVWPGSFAKAVRFHDRD